MKETVRQWRKKPVSIYAIKWDGTNQQAVLAFCKDADPHFSEEFQTISLRTLEGSMTAPIGHYIIRGVAGEFYPCDPSIFVATYEET